MLTCFLIDSAHLTAEDALPHLFHFCSVLPKQASYDLGCRPVFSIESEDGKLFRATVILPSCIDPAVRIAQGTQTWQTQRAAMKDAAFQAYKALYEFGLVNDNLLPRSMKRELRQYIGYETRLPSIIMVRKRWDPWVDMAQAWSASPHHYQTPIEVKVNGLVDEELSMTMTTSVAMAGIEPIDLFWDSGTTFTVSFGSPVQIPALSREAEIYLQMITTLYMKGPRPKKPYMDEDYVALISPRIPVDQARAWFKQYGGTYPATEVYESGRDPRSMGVVRDRTQIGKTYIFHKWTHAQLEDDNPPVLMMNGRDLPKRRNLLKRQTLAKPREDYSLPLTDSRRSGYLGDTTYAPRTQLIPIDRCTFDQLSLKQARFGVFIPSVMYVLEMTMVATRLRDTVLKDVGFENVYHIITAITAPSAHGLADYQRYEFFGDTLLKFTASCRLFVEHPHWHEGYLSERRDNIIKNRRLAGASLSMGLDKYITTEMYSPRRWKPPLIKGKTEQDPKELRRLSRKILADVIEALIGAAFFDGGQEGLGYEMARKCVYALVPEIHSARADFSCLPRPKNQKYTVSHDERLKDLIGYKFHDETLLTEALTHPSCDYDLETQSYQRLEFLGDAVLDMVVISTIARHPVEVQPGRMTRMKHALVSANLLAFLCMEFGFMRERTIISAPTAPAQTKDQERNPVTEGVETTTVQEKVAMWRFLRFRDKSQLSISRNESVKRHELMRDEILDALEHSMRFPWEALARVNADKLFSDVFESVLGAIYVDSNGNLDVCREYLEHIGLLPLVRRFLNEPIDLNHPVNLVLRVAKSNKIGYTFRKERIAGDDLDGLKVSNDSYTWVSVGSGYSYSCMADVLGTPIATVQGCLTKEEANVKVAALAIERIRANGLETYLPPDTGAVANDGEDESKDRNKDEGEGHSKGDARDGSDTEFSSDDDVFDEDDEEAGPGVRDDIDDDDADSGYGEDADGVVDTIDWQNAVQTTVVRTTAGQDTVAEAADDWRSCIIL